MRNILGRVPETSRILGLEGVHLHLYDKAPRPRRKLGHVNVVGEDPEQVRTRLAAVRKVVEE